MRIRNREISFWLLMSKLFKVARIKLAFIVPTWRAKLILKLLQCPYGKNLQVCGKVYFRPNGKGTIKLGDQVSLTARFLSNTVGITNPVMLECMGDGCIEIGNHSGLTSAILSSRRLIRIGEHVKVGGNVRIFDHDFHSLDYRHRRKCGGDFEQVKMAEVIIEDDVFIGANAMILKGVHIGARSIIAAGSIVTCKQIPADSIVAGNPAKIIRSNRTVYL